MITRTNFYKKYEEELAFGLALGLAFGLTSGLVFGLAVGLTSGLVFGLALGLAFGLTSGLVVGLAVGLAVILINFKEALPFISGFYPIVFLILGIILLSEILFFLMKREKLSKGTNIFWHTCKRKLECIFEVLLGLSGITQVYILIRETDFVKYFPEILKWVGYIGLGMIILIGITGIFYLWIKLNSIKYKEVKHGTRA